MVCPAMLVLFIFIAVPGLLQSGSGRVFQERRQAGCARVQQCAGLLDGLPSGQEGEDLLEIEEQVKAQGARVKQSKNSTAEVCYSILLTSVQCIHSLAVMSDFPHMATSTTAGTARHIHGHDSERLELCSCKSTSDP